MLVPFVFLFILFMVALLGGGGADRQEGQREGVIFHVEIGDTVHTQAQYRNRNGP